MRTLTRRRGLYQLGPLTAVSGDPFGLFRSWRTVPEMAELLVYPATVDLSAFGLPAGELPGGRRARRAPSMSRPMRPACATTCPATRSTASTGRPPPASGRLMVREFELDPTSNIWIVLDLDRAAHVGAASRAGNRRAPRWRYARACALSAVEGEGDAPAAPQPLYLEPETEEYAVTIAASLAAHFLQTVGRWV